MDKSIALYVGLDYSLGQFKGLGLTAQALSAHQEENKPE